MLSKLYLQGIRIIIYIKICVSIKISKLYWVFYNRPFNRNKMESSNIWNIINHYYGELFK